MKISKNEEFVSFKNMKMQVDDLSHVKPDVDYSQIPPIQQKRIIAFVNHFVTNTVSYLNNFCQSCESRFMEFEYKMQKIEASLLILEAQLSSIPRFEKADNLTESDIKSNDKSNSQTTELPEHKSEQVSSNKESNQPVIETENQVVSGIKASEHPQFVKFFKMIRVGVHEQAVRLKMQSEGIDPTILDNPDAIIQDSEENY